MPADTAWLDRGLAALQELVTRAERDPLARRRWLRPQDAFLRLDERRKIYRAGNQALGKTEVALAEMRYHLEGSHPYHAVRQGAVHWLVCSLNQSQSLAIQEKFNDMLPAELLSPITPYNMKTGFGANKPKTILTNGSSVRWVTDDQGPRSVAGGTVDGVLVDEPCGPDMWRELNKRLLIRRGPILAAFTPINGPIAHFKAEVESGLLAEVHAPLTVDNCRFADTGEIRRLLDGTLCNQAWIDEIFRSTIGRWSGIINNGDWETLIEGVLFTCFDEAKHVRADVRLNPERGAPMWVLGFDYAAADRPLGHVASLCQVQRTTDLKGRHRWRIYAADEVALGGTASNTTFADGVLAMLDRNRIAWTDLHAVHGDNPVTSRWVEKSNINTEKAIARARGIGQNSLQPRILNAKDGVASGLMMDKSIQWLWETIADDLFHVSPRCKALIEGLKTWDYSKMHPYKDAIDACRYALKPMVFEQARPSGVQTHFYGRR